MTVRTYTENPYLKEIKANVLEKKEEDGKFLIKLDRTIFYPHLAGGQPRDKGTIDGKTVVDVYEDGMDVIHVLSEDILSDKVELVIDWENRFDLMQQHTGQHLLSANIFTLYGAETESFHFGDDYVSIEVTKEEILEKEMRQIEYLTNKMIQSNYKIKCYIPDEEELKEIPLRKIPDTDPLEKIRIVEIEGLDFSPCCGTHLNSTGELGLIKVRRWEKTKGRTKIDFVCGNRALKDYGWKNQYIYKLGELLSSKDTDVLNKVEKLLEDKKSLEKQISNLKEKLSIEKAQSFYNNSNVHDGINYIVSEFENTDLKDINRIYNNLSEYDNLIQIYTTKNEDISQFIIGSSKNLNVPLNDFFIPLRSELKIRGGGNNILIQGGSTDENVKILVKEMYSNIRNFFKN